MISSVPGIDTQTGQRVELNILVQSVEGPPYPYLKDRGIRWPRHETDVGGWHVAR